MNIDMKDEDVKPDSIRARACAATVAACMLCVSCLLLVPFDSAEAKQGPTSACAVMQKRVAKGFARNAKVVRVKSGVRITRNSLRDACTKARYSNAAYMHKVSSCQIWGPTGSKYASFVKIRYLSAKKQKALRRKENAILKSMPLAMSQAEKVKVIHDAINMWCSYDWDSYLSGKLAPNSGNAYGCLVSGKCVCAGYADAFHLVALRAGLKSAYVSSGNHAWNLARVDGKWYHVDLCWDDTGNNERKWLLKGSRFAGAERRCHTIAYCYPKRVAVAAEDFSWPVSVDPPEEAESSSELCSTTLSLSNLADSVNYEGMTPFGDE